VIPDSTQSADKAREQADKLRSEMHGTCLEFDTSDIEDKLVQAVTQYTTPQARRQEIAAAMQSGKVKEEAEVEALRLEYAALGRLINTQMATGFRFGSNTATSMTLGMLTEGFDFPTLLNEMHEQAQNLADKDTEAIKALLAEQAVAHHVAHHTIYSSKNAPTTEGRAITAKHGVNMLETSARIVERLSKIDQPRPGNIYARQANIARNQLIQNGQKVDVAEESLDNVKSDN
jgi:hypothetical protein